MKIVCTPSPEVCDGVDNDCDELIDEGVKNTYYRDADGDGKGDPCNSTQACSQPQGYVTNNSDCCGESGPNTYYRDADGDGKGDPCNSTQSCTQPPGYVTNNSDCCGEGTTEICDGIDNDCDGLIDEGVTKNTYYRDADGDGKGDPCNSTQACTQPQGYVINNFDCCGESGPNTYYRDADGDGYGDPSNSTTACTQPAGYVSNNQDCNDGNSSIHPGATDIPCNGVDENCDGHDEGVVQTWYKDVDNDGYSDGSSTTSCTRPNGYKLPSELIATSGDCNDNNANIRPGATEVCNNGVDDDCNGQVDEGCPTCTDNDNDGYYAQSGCDTLVDCNDGNASIHPGALERCNGVDDDCDGQIDEGSNPKLSTSPRSLTFRLKQGQNTCKPLFVWNRGCGTLQWQASEPCTWLTLQPASGDSTGEKDTVNVCVDATGLSRGTYNCTISITSNGGNKTIPVRLTVRR